MYKVYILVFLLFGIFDCYSQNENEYKEWVQNQNIPLWVQQSFDQNDMNDGYKIEFRLNPFYLRGDFNGDTKLDICVLIKNKESGKTGIAVFHNTLKEVKIIGAGNPLNNSIDDFDWMGIWRIYEQEKDPLPFNSVGEVIFVEKPESAGGLIYWNGDEYVWHQWGD